MWRGGDRIAALVGAPPRGDASSSTTGVSVGDSDSAGGDQRDGPSGVW